MCIRSSFYGALKNVQIDKTCFQKGTENSLKYWRHWHVSVSKVDENGRVKERVHRDARAHALVWVCACLCACVCVTVHNWAIDAGILLGPCHSILTQVANMAGDCKNSCMCWLRSEYRILWMCVGTCRKTIRETHSSMCSFIYLQKQSLCWRENDVLFSWITTINCVLLMCVPQLDTEFVVCCSNKV